MKYKKDNHHHLKTWIGLALILLIFTACNSSMRREAAENQNNQLEQQWGIRPVALRLVGSDHFVDFRYRVIDPDKAATLLSRNNKPYLIHEASGKVHTVPVTKLGPMRASAIKPKAARNYVVIFGNTRKIIKKGSMVTVVIGDFRAEHMKVM